MSKADVIVAGHTCLDIIPSLNDSPQGKEAVTLDQVLAPGRLRQVGPMVLATGGAVPNTGLALHRLGTAVRLVGKVGDDMIGQAILALIRQHDSALTDGMIVTPGEESSYTVILSAPGIDRTFLHYPGPNRSFGADDVTDDVFREAKIFHFGYPALMRRFYLDNGNELLKLFGRARAQGLVTSLDVTQPDPHSEAGQVDWRKLLARVLPQVDIFLPGFEETLLMLDPDRYTELVAEAGSDSLVTRVNGALLDALATELLQFGAAIVGLKLGNQGMYLRTTADHARLKMLEATLPLRHRAWLQRELLAPAFAVQVVGTTGAGDCAIAGFLTGLIKGLNPDEVLQSAVAVGACNVEAADAVSGVPTWSEVQHRLAAGWAQRSTQVRLRGWGWNVDRKLWIGPHDRGGLIAGMLNCK